MKKQLLLAALILGAASANAQIEKIVVDGSAASLGTEASAITAGTVLGSSESITVKTAYDDSYKVVSCAFQGYNNVIVNGCLSGADDYAQDLRYNGRPSQTLRVYNEDGNFITYEIVLG